MLDVVASNGEKMTPVWLNRGREILEMISID